TFAAAAQGFDDPGAPAGKLPDVRSKKQWRHLRADVLDRMQQAMGPLPARDDFSISIVDFVDSVQFATYTRYHIRFPAAPNEPVYAYLYKPNAAGRKKVAAMLVLHGTGALGKDLVDGKSPRPNRALAKELAERGYAVIAPDYPGMGELKHHDFSA